MSDAGAIIDEFRRRQAAFYAGGSSEALADILEPDVAWHVPGDNAISGDYWGRDAVLGYFERRRALSSSTLGIAAGGRLVDGDAVVELADGSATIAGEAATWRTVGVYRVIGRSVAEGWLVPLDLRRFDEIWRRRP